jgi:heterodisulfide reductase subunit C
MNPAEMTIPARSWLAEEVLLESGQNVNLCYQCSKCGAGCPVAYALDYSPVQLIHAIRLGLDDLVLNSRTIWLCASCETCTTRCPQDVEVAKVMDAAKIIAVRRGVRPALPRVSAFHRATLGNIRSHGRMYELGLIIGLKLRTREFSKDAALGIGMLRRGKLKLWPGFKGSRTTRRIFRRVERIEKHQRDRLA